MSKTDWNEREKKIRYGVAVNIALQDVLLQSERSNININDVPEEAFVAMVDSYKRLVDAAWESYEGKTEEYKQVSREKTSEDILEDLDL